MITRRRGRSVNATAVQPLEVAEVDAVETDEDLPSPTEELLSEDVDAAGMELDDLFGIDELRWTLEKDAVSPLFDIQLADFGLFGAEGQDSGVIASTGSSPDRTEPDVKSRSRKNQPRNVRNVVNKNAMAARMNRLKKKEYVSSLERRVGALAAENGVLKQENVQLTQRVEELEGETRYLRAVLANESTLAQLLSRLSGENGMKLSSSLFQGHDPNDHDYALPRKRVKVEEKETAGGVCLHVDQNHVSVEFCTKCAESASTTLRM